MKILFIVLVPLFLFLQNITEASPRIGFGDLMSQAEQNPELVARAKTEAMRNQLPLNIVTTSKIMYDVKSLEDGKPVYAVITDLLNPFNGGYTAFYEDIMSQINLGNARIYYGNGNVVDNTGGYFDPILVDSRGVLQYLMIPDISNDKVLLFNAQNGDLVDNALIPTTSPQLQTPKHALQAINPEQILVSDQISDAVQKFDAFGSYIGIFAPAGGVNTAILDNIRGMAYRPNNNLLVTVGSGASTNTVQQFDTAGNPLGAFINTSLSSPFDILYRQNDILVTNSGGTNRISKYDLNGSFISSFYTGSDFAFPQQMHRLPNGNVLVAAFSPPSGIAVLDSNGIFLRLIGTITGNRGVYLLGNGHYLTTNGSGVHEIDSSSGSLIRTVVGGGNFQYISLYKPLNYLLSLKINLEACTVTDTLLVELRSATPPYSLVESQRGIGGLGAANVFRFSMASNSTPYYIVVKHRNSVTTWSSNTPMFVGNDLSYNFTSAASQAFGSNMINVGGLWSFFQGDIDRNGAINLTDILSIFNDATAFVSGSYVLTDLNCDTFVNLTDILVASNNSTNFIQEKRP